MEMALWDICGKALGVPVWQLLGGRYRDKARLYADTPEVQDPLAFAAKLKARVDEQGFTWLKMDLGIHLLRQEPGTLVNQKYWDEHGGIARNTGKDNYMNYYFTEHPFTQIQVTEKGLAKLVEYVEDVRNAVGNEIPISADHFGYIDMNQAIRIGKAVDKYRLAWLEDLNPWFYTDSWKAIRAALETPVATGEDIYICFRGC